MSLEYTDSNSLSDQTPIKYLLIGNSATMKIIAEFNSGNSSLKTKKEINQIFSKLFKTPDKKYNERNKIISKNVNYFFTFCRPDLIYLILVNNAYPERLISQLIDKINENNIPTMVNDETRELNLCGRQSLKILIDKFQNPENVNKIYESQNVLYSKTVDINKNQQEKVEAKISLEDKDEKKNKYKEIENLQNKKQILEKDKESIKKNNKNEINEIENLSNENQMLKKENELIKKENKILKVEIKNLKEEFDSLHLSKDQEMKKIEKKYKILIEEKNKNIENLILKLTDENQNYNNLLVGEKLIAINFISVDQSINHTIICKNTTKFHLVENQLHEKYSNYINGDNFFISNGRIIDRFKTLEDNGFLPYTIMLKKIGD